jgi:signal peptidase I
VGVLAAVLGVLALAGLIRASGLGVVVTHGNSMAPRFATGDLAVTVASARYGVGDVVAYRSATLQTVVLHRIIRAPGNRFATKGDNNSWVDPDRPSAAEIQGKLLVRVPQAGRLVSVVRHPVGAVAVGLLLVAFPVFLRRARSKKGGSVSDHAATPTDPPASKSRSAAGLGAAAVVLGLLAISAVWLAPKPGAGSIGSIPASTAEAAGGAASGSATAERITVGYQARTSATATYSNGVVRTGDPIFVKAVRILSVTATHSGRDDVAVALTAELAHPTGWHRTIPLGAVAIARSAGTTTATGTLDMRMVTTVLNGFAAETGVPAPGSTMSLVVQAGSWTKRAEFTFDGIQFRAEKASLAGSRTAPPTAAGTPKTTAQLDAAPATQPVLAPVGRLLPTATLRVGVTVGIGLLVLSAALALWRRQSSAG